MSSRSVAPWLLVFSCLSIVAFGCGDGYEFRRQTPERGTLGEELYAIWQKDAARSSHDPQGKVRLLGRRRETFVRSVDTMAPEKKLPEIDRFIHRILPTVDSDRLPSLTRKTEIVLREAAADRHLLEEMTREPPLASDTFHSHRIRPRWTTHWVEYDRLRDLLSETAEVALARDGVEFDDDPSGEASDNVYQLQRALLDAIQSDEDGARGRGDADGGEASTSSDDGGTEGGEENSQESSSETLRRLLLTEDERFAPAMPSGGEAAGANEAGVDASGSGSGSATSDVGIAGADASDASGSESLEGPLYAVHVDERGYPRVRTNDRGVVAPFRDRDGDGLADLDDQGRFELGDGREAAHIPAFARESTTRGVRRDEYGRASVQGAPLFDYVDLEKTGLGFASRHLSILYNKGVLWDLLDGRSAILGRTASSDDWGAYTGYRVDAPVVDAARHLLTVLKASILPELARSAADFIDRHGRAIAELVRAFEQFGDAIDRHPDTKLAANSTIGYDLLSLLHEIASSPQLWHDVLAALRDPVTLKADEAFTRLVRHRDQRVVPPRGGAYDRCFQSCRAEYERKAKQKGVADEHPFGIGMVGRYECIQECRRRSDEIFTKDMDFDAPESKANRSLFQRLLHLLRDAAGAPYTIRVTDAKIGVLSNLPPVAEISGSSGEQFGGGEAFVRSIAGNLEMDNLTNSSYDDFSGIANLLGAEDIPELLSKLTKLMGAQLDPQTKPSQITRLFNQKDIHLKCNKIDEISGVAGALSGLVCNGGKDTFAEVNEPVCNDGYEYWNHHADMLYASEASGLIDAIQPISKAFSDHGRETLLLELFIVIHEHYSSRDDLYLQADDITPSPMKGANLVSYEPVLRDAMADGYLIGNLHRLAKAIGDMPRRQGRRFQETLRRLVVHATEGGFTDEDGTSTYELPDGDVVDEPSRLHFLISALSSLSDHLKQRPEAKEALDRVTSTLGERFADVEEDETGRARFERPGTLALASLGLREMADEAAALQNEGTLQTRLTETWPNDLQTAPDRRTVTNLVELSESLRSPDSRRKLLEDALDHLLGTEQGRIGVVTLVYQLLVPTIEDDGGTPVVDFAASVLHPNRTWDVQRYRDVPLISHVLRLLQRVLRIDDDGTGFEMLERGMRQPDDGGKRPLAALGDLVMSYFRLDPDAREPFGRGDYTRAYRQIAAWLADETHGLEQFYDIVEKRRDAADDE